MARGWRGRSVTLVNMRVDINLATQPYEDSRRFWLRWGGGLIALGVLSLILIYVMLAGMSGARTDRKTIQQLEAQIAARDQERAQAQALLDEPQNRSTRDRSQFLNDLFQRKAFSWTLAFEDLEKLMPSRLHVVSIHPELTPDHQLQINLAVAGDSRDKALELVRNMESSKRFRETEIEKESVGRETNDACGVEFNITALYIPSSDLDSDAPVVKDKNKVAPKISSKSTQGGL